MIRVPQALALLSVPVAVGFVVAQPSAAAPPVGGTLDLTSNPDSRLAGDGAGARAGSAVALAPGFAAIGEPGHGGATGRIRFLRASGDQARPGPWLAGPGERARAGSALAAVGDDGLIIGAPRAKVAGRGRPGMAFLVTAPETTRRLRRGDSRAVTILGEADDDRAGSAVASVPDVDRDGRPEVAIGAPRGGIGGAGVAYVILSRGLEPGDVVDLRSPEVLRIVGPGAGAHAGAALAGSPDVDGDGNGEVVVGTPELGPAQAGAVYVVHLSPATRTVDLAVAGPWLALTGSPGARAGAAVAVLGDVTGDRLPDVAVGAPGETTAGRGAAGVVHIVAGGARTGSVSLAGEPGGILGERAGDAAGASLSTAGDVDDNGTPDVLVGAPDADPLGRASAGAAYVVSGSAAARGVDLALAAGNALRLTGGRGGAGTAVTGGAGPGDIALLIGAPFDRKPGSAGGGTVFVRPAPNLPGLVRGEAGCETPALSVVLDDAPELAQSDPDQLRGQALQLLVRQPASANRVVTAVEAAARPSEIFLPLRLTTYPTTLQKEVLPKLIGEATRSTSRGGDVGEAVNVANALSGAAASSLIVAGPEATGVSPAATSNVDVIAVGVPPGSPRESALRALAGTTGRYASVQGDDLQAQAALFDAQRRCETPLPERVNGRPVLNPQDVPALATSVHAGEDFRSSTEVPGETAFVDLVLSWTSADAEIDVYRITVDASGGRRTVFRGQELKDALAGMPVCERGIRLTAAGGATFATFRIGFGGEDASAARHRRHRVNQGGGSRGHNALAGGGVALYQQFFAPPPGVAEDAVPSSACGTG